jgi:PTS system mannose-specific IIB component
MSITFLRVDDRMIHGQTCTRWALEYPCDGIVAVNDAAANNAVLKAAYKSASGKKTFVWTMEHWQEKCQQVIHSDTRYFLITKNPLDMKKILVDQKFDPGIRKVIVGPCNDRPGAVELGNNQSITPEEASAFEEIMKAGYSIDFALIKEKYIGDWQKFRGKFGFSD